MPQIYHILLKYHIIFTSGYHHYEHDHNTIIIIILPLPPQYLPEAAGGFGYWSRSQLFVGPSESGWTSEGAPKWDNAGEDDGKTHGKLWFQYCLTMVRDR